MDQSLQVSIDFLTSKFNNLNWVKCPLCEEEWTKLRPCRFLNAEWQEEWFSVCVVCAETLVSFSRVVGYWPQESIEVQVRWNGPKFLHVGKQTVDIPRNAYAKISYGGQNFVATSEGTGKPLRFKEARDEQESFADNVFELWSKIRYRLHHPIETEQGETRMEKVEKMIRKSSRLIPMALAIAEMWRK